MQRSFTMLGVVLAIAAGCGDRTSDSNSAPALSVATVDLQLGTVQGGGPESFGRIGGLTTDAAGRIFVADSQAGEIRVFNAEGVHLYSFGGRGSGPGELLGPCCIAWSPDSLLWVRDGRNHRYSGFAADDEGATYRASVEMAHSDVNFWAPTTFTASGELIDVGHRTSPTGITETVRFTVAEDGGVVGERALPSADPGEIGQFTVTREIEGGVSRYYFYQPFAPRQLAAHGPMGAMGYGLGSTYAFTIINGEREIRIEGVGIGPNLSGREREIGLATLERDAEQAGVRRAQLPYGLPDRKPPVQAIFFDTAGRLWVELSQEDGAPKVADVWSTTGELVKRVQWDSDITLGFPGSVGEDTALGLRRDGLGVEYVVRLNF